MSLADSFNYIINAGDTVNLPPGGKKREEWVLSSSYSKTHNLADINMSINPNSVRFNQAKRISSAKRTIGGTTFFHWSDKNGRNLDPLILTIAGETGTISGLGKDAQLQKSTS